jgi:hypothetical protein
MYAAIGVGGSTIAVSGQAVWVRIIPAMYCRTTRPRYRTVLNVATSRPPRRNRTVLPATMGNTYNTEK